VIAVLWMVIKRLFGNYVLAAAMLAGLVTAVAITAGISLYSDGALQRLLQERWSFDRDPGVVALTYTGSPGRPVTLEQYRKATDYIEQELPRMLALPIGDTSRSGAMEMQLLAPADPRHAATFSRYGQLRFLSNLLDHVEITDGRLPQPRRGPDEPIEAVIDEQTLHKQDMLVGQAYLYPLIKVLDAPAIPVRIVGAFRARSMSAPYWYRKPPLTDGLYVPEETFHEVLSLPRATPDGFTWYFTFNHRKLRFTEVERLANGFEDLTARVLQIMPNVRIEVSPVSVLQAFQGRGFYLRLLLAILSLPILGMTLYYTVMVAGIVLDRQAGEIAVLRSRGAGRMQVLLVSLLEWSVVGLAALPLGLLAGVILAKVLGATAGFLTFANRQPLPLLFTHRTLWFALAGVLAGIAAAMIPAFFASGRTIVLHKQEQARQARPPAWRRFYVDFLLLGASWYGYRLLSRQSLLKADSPLLYDPSLFVVPVLLVAGGALLTVRLLPYLLTGLAWASAALRGAPATLALWQLSRSPIQTAPLVLLLILTVGLGTFNANAARTLDVNFSDRVLYGTGADIVLQERWQLDYTPEQLFTRAGGPRPIVEPPWELHHDLPGVRAAARVFVQRGRALIGTRDLGGGQLFGIEPVEFSTVGFLRRDLEQYHVNWSLSLFASHPDGALVSSSFLARTRLQLGDSFTLRLANQPPLDVRIIGTLNYWPTVDVTQEDFFVMALPYLNEELGLLPYQVWLRVEEQVSAAQIIRSLAERGITVEQVRDARAVISAERREPSRTGLFGLFSLAFFASGGLTAAGFLLGSILGLQKRLVQFGVLRAMGLSIGQLAVMLALEQLLVMFIGVAAGSGLGYAATELFVPFLQGATDRFGRVPPFRIVEEGLDLVRMYSVLFAVLLIALAATTWAVRRMRVHEAVKLGEEN
jgi:putative ABC transport system permease protein